METAIGIDLGGTNIKAVLLNAKGDVMHQLAQATQPASACNNKEGQYWKQTVSQMILELKSRSASPVNTIGLAAPGLPNETNSAIRVMPARLNGLENLIWTDYLSEKEVWVLNDAHAALIAEARFGIGRGKKNIVMLTWGTGVGGGILINGKLFQGSCQMAGHLGHMILDVGNEDQGIVGMPGTLENAISDATISKRSFGRIRSTHDLVKAYRQGDSFATYLWLNTLRKLALGLCSLCNLLSPELIILGGGVTKAGDALYKPLADFIDLYEWKNTGKKTLIKQARYGEMAGAVGAAGFAFHKAALTD